LKWATEKVDWGKNGKRSFTVTKKSSTWMVQTVGVVISVISERMRSIYAEDTLVAVE